MEVLLYRDYIKSPRRALDCDGLVCIIEQSLVMWGLAPVLILLSTLLVFLVYFCQRCCRKKEENTEIKHIQYFRVSATVLAIISLLV